MVNCDIIHYKFWRIVKFGAHYVGIIAQKTKNKFWKDTLSSFVRLCKTYKTFKDNNLEFPLFYNNNIVIGGKTVFLKSFYENGVQYICDLLKKDGYFYHLD